MPSAAPAPVRRHGSQQPAQRRQGWGEWAWGYLSWGNYHFWSALGYEMDEPGGAGAGRGAADGAYPGSRAGSDPIAEAKEVIASLQALLPPGSALLGFEATSYAAAIRTSAARGGMLLVYLHDSGNPACAGFVRQVLGNLALAAFVQGSALAWTGDVARREGARFAASLRRVTTPYLCVCIPEQGGRAARVLELPPAPAALLAAAAGAGAGAAAAADAAPARPAAGAGVGSAIEYVDTVIAMLLHLQESVVGPAQEQKQQQAQQSVASRSIVRQQDREYEDAVQADLRARQQQVEEDRKAQAQAAAARAVEEAQQSAKAKADQYADAVAEALAARTKRLAQRRGALVQEPTGTAGAGAATAAAAAGALSPAGSPVLGPAGVAVTEVAVRLPSGKRLTRKFSVFATLNDVLEFVETSDVAVAELFRAPPPPRGVAPAATAKPVLAGGDDGKADRAAEYDAAARSAAVELDSCDFSIDYTLSTTFPRAEYADLGKTLADLGLVRRVMLALDEAEEGKGLRRQRIAALQRQQGQA